MARVHLQLRQAGVGVRGKVVIAGNARHMRVVQHFRIVSTGARHHAGILAMTGKHCQLLTTRSVIVSRPGQTVSGETGRHPIRFPGRPAGTCKHGFSWHSRRFSMSVSFSDCDGNLLLTPYPQPIPPLCRWVGIELVDTGERELDRAGAAVWQSETLNRSSRT